MKLKKILVAVGFAFGSLTLLAPTPSKSQGGCPNSFYPVGGGYCRNIVCIEGYFGSGFGEQTAIDTLAKYKQSCAPANDTERAMILYGSSYPKIAKWGDKMVPMR